MRPAFEDALSDLLTEYASEGFDNLISYLELARYALIEQQANEDYDEDFSEERED